MEMLPQHFFPSQGWHPYAPGTYEAHWACVREGACRRNVLNKDRAWTKNLNQALSASESNNSKEMEIGEHRPLREWYECVPHAGTHRDFPLLTNASARVPWQVRLVRDAARSYGAPLFPLFDARRTRWDSHPGQGDCTHVSSANGSFDAEMHILFELAWRRFGPERSP